MEKTKKLTTKKLILIIVAVFVLCVGGLVALLFARNHIKEVASEDDYGYINPDETKADTDEGFTIDGVLDEVQYQNNNWLYLHNQEGGADVDIAMTSYFGEKGMYFVYDVTEGNPIYVNTDRSSYLNSCIEMYLAPSTSTKILSNSVFEIDMLPSGDMTFKKSNGASGYTNVATKSDTMAVLGTTTKGGELNTEECYGYYLELFIPWDYMEYLDMDTEAMKDGYVYVNPAHITSFNYTGTDLNVDRYWYSFAQKHGATFSDVYQYYKFDGDGNIGAVPVTLEDGEHYSIEGDKAVIPGMQAQITITPEDGYAINSILVNGKEYIKKASYNEDGSITLTLRGEEDGLKVSAVAEAVTAGNKTLTGTVSAHKYGGGSISGLEASYMGPTGEKPLEVDSKGKFVLSDLAQGYYTITIEKEGYDKLVRGIYVNRNIDVELTLEYPMFTTESGFSYVLDNQNDGLLKRFGSRGIVLTKDSYNKFSVESYFRYDTKLEEEAEHDHFDQQRSGIRIKFSNEKYWHINILKQYDSYRVAYAKHTGDSSVFSWATVYKLSEEEAKKYESEEGIKLEVQRDGKYAAIYLDDKLIAVEILDDEYAKCTAQVGFETWTANRQIVDMKYKITSSTEKNITNVYFKRPTEWDVTGQFDGYVTLPKDHDGDSGWLIFDKKYGNVDVTVTMRDYDSSNTDERMAIQFNFGNSRRLCVTVTNDANKSGEHIVQTMGDTVFGWKKLCTLTDEQVAKFQSEDGIDLRVIRKGTVAAIYLDGVHLCDADLTVDKDGNATGITADTTADVAIRNYGNLGYQVDVPFSISEKAVETVTIELKASDKGTPVTDKLLYQPGETVVLSGKGTEGYYCTGLKVNGKDVTLNWDGTYTFKATEKKYTVEGTYAERVFNDSKEWNLLNQNKGVISLPAEHDGDSGWVQSYKKYTDIDFELTLRDYDSSNTDERMAIKLNFGDDKTLCLTVTNDANKSGEHIVQTMDDAIFGWKKLYTLSDAEVASLRSEEGLDFRVVRVGTVVAVYLNDIHVYDVDLTVDKDGKGTGITADSESTVAVRHYGNVGYAVDMPFTLSDEEIETVQIDIKDSENGTLVIDRKFYLQGETVVLSGSGVADYYCYGYNVDGKFVEADKNGNYSFEATKDVYEVEALFAKQFFTGWKTDNCWDFTKQYKNIIALNSTCEKTTHATYVGATKAYTDVDFTVKVKDGTNKSMTSKTMLILKFNDNNNTKNGRVDLSIQSNGDDVFVYLNCAGTGGNDSIVYTLTKEEAQKYKSDGIEMRMVRKGLKLALYLDGNQCKLTNDTYNICQNGVVTLTASTYITETMKTSLVLQHIHDAGAQVEFPYQLNTSVEQVTIEVTDSENGTIVPESGLYVLGDTVVLSSEAVDGYYCSEMKVDGQIVETNEDGTYIFKAEKESYTVKGSFAKKVFKDSSAGDTLWNLSRQNQGSVTLTNGRTGIKGVVSAFTDAATAAGKYTALEFYDSYTDIDLTLTVKNDPNTSKGETPRTAVEFAFTNNQKVKFSVTEASGDVYIITMDGLINWKRIYKFTDEQEAKYRSAEGVELRVVRKGTQFFFSIDGVVCEQGSEASASTWYQADIIDLTAITDSTVEATTEATVKLLHYGDAGQWIEMPFTVTGTVNALFTGWKTDNCWKLTKQYIDILSLDGSSCTKTNHATYVGAGKAYTDVDFTVKVKDGTNESVTSKTLFILKFNDNNNANRGWVGFSIQSSGNDVFIYLKCADTGGNDSIVYTLTEEEAQKYKSGGIEMRVVRKGLKLTVYLDGNQCELTNDTYSICQNGVVTLKETTYITETMKTSLVLQHLHDVGAQVEFPYELYTTVEEEYDVSTANVSVLSLLKKLLLND